MCTYFQISRIGLPTQVAHTGHARTEEEAKKLIEQLMLGGGSADQDGLPQPMAPSPGKTSILCANQFLRGEYFFYVYDYACGEMHMSVQMVKINLPQLFFSFLLF